MIYKELTDNEKKELLLSLGEKNFRQKQIEDWINKGAESFEEMKNLPARLKQELREKGVELGSLGIATAQHSMDGTVKYLLKLPDGNCVEAVFMKYEYGNSICISTQVGCAMGCSFCASGLGGRIRNLKAWEMLDEYLIVRKACGEAINHVVLMGIGEPFDNYQQVSSFLREIHKPSGINLSYRNITLSTCGIADKIKQFTEDFPQVNLAVSLHSADQAARESIMPVAKAHKLPELMAVCREHTEKTGRRITFEYALMAGNNDSPRHAEMLSRLLSGMLCHVNLIPLNAVTECGLAGSSRDAAVSFAEQLQKLGIPATVRRSLGRDIDAACGQLRRKANSSETV